MEAPIAGDIDLAEGYVRCACGAQVLEHVSHLTGRQCMDCFVSSPAMARVRAIEVVVHDDRGRQINATLPARANGRGGSVRRSPSNVRRREMQELNRNAARAALHRLRNLAPELYDLLHAEERHKRNLPPVPKREWGYLARVAAEYDPVAVYDPGDRGGPG